MGKETLRAFGGGRTMDAYSNMQGAVEAPLERDQSKTFKLRSPRCVLRWMRSSGSCGILWFLSVLSVL
jgi:hypothetical protein